MLCLFSLPLTSISLPNYSNIKSIMDQRQKLFHKTLIKRNWIDTIPKVKLHSETSDKLWGFMNDCEGHVIYLILAKRLSFNRALPLKAFTNFICWKLGLKTITPPNTIVPLNFLSCPFLWKMTVLSELFFLLMPSKWSHQQPTHTILKFRFPATCSRATNLLSTWYASNIHDFF